MPDGPIWTILISGTALAGLFGLLGVLARGWWSRQTEREQGAVMTFESMNKALQEHADREREYYERRLHECEARCEQCHEEHQQTQEELRQIRDRLRSLERDAD